MKVLFLFLLFILVPISCFAEKSPPICNLSKGNFFFVGREEQLQGIQSFFKKGGQVLAITGGPGFGKTQIAKRYAQQSHSHYDLVWWFDANQDIPFQFERLALALNKVLSKEEQILPSKLSKDALVDAVKNILRSKRLKYLLIFDNTENYDDIEKFLPFTNNQPGQHVLLTSRNANIWPEKIEIGKFKREESLCLIKNALPKEKIKDGEKLAEALSDYPLGLTISIAFMKAHPTTTIDKYIAMYLKRAVHSSKKSEEFIKTSSPLLNTYANDTQAALSISLRAIEESAPDALKALLFMSFLNSKDIPDSYIDIWLEKTKSKLTSAEVIKLIYDQSLLDIRRVSQEEREPIHFLSLHDLIHQFINEGIAMEDKRTLINTATEAMLEVFSGPSEVFTKKILSERIHLLHAQKLCKSASRMDYTSNNLLKLKICIFECLMGGVRDFEAAKLYLEDIQKDFKAGYSVEPYYLALFKINTGFIESIYTNYDEAIHYMKEGLSLLNSLGKYDEERLRALTNLAQCHALIGKTAIAETFIEQGEHLFNNSQSEVFNSLFLYTWSLVLNDQGKFEDSLYVLDKAKAYPTLSINYPTLDHAILLQKIESLIKLGRPEEAKQAIEECDEKIKLFYQKRKNAALANILVFRSLVWIYNNEPNPNIFENITKALEFYDSFFHGDKKHRSQARAHLALGKAYTANQNFDKALQEYLFSEEIYNKILKEKTIDDVSELYKELALLGIKMKNEEITQKYLKAHLDTFGRAHPRTKEILIFLDKSGLTVPF